MQDEIRKKMDDHINEILAQSSISNEDYALLHERLSELPQKNNGFDLWWLLILPFVFGWGGDKHDL